MLAMVGNDNAWYLTPRSVLRLIASMLAPTGGRGHQFLRISYTSMKRMAFTMLESNGCSDLGVE